MRNKALKSLRVLLVEDEENIARLLKVLLEIVFTVLPLQKMAKMA